MPPVMGSLRHAAARRLPRGWPDLIRQLSLFVLAYALYELVRGVVNGNDVARASWNATRVIDLERALHVFVEPQIQSWAMHREWLIDIADAIYLNAHTVVTVGVLAFIYMRRNDSFYFVRNTFMIAMAIALVGYAIYPTAPPRLMGQWGFVDTVEQFTGIRVQYGPGSELLNLYAAIPSMHVCFAVLVAWPMRRLVRRRAARIAWGCYPALIAWVVVATGNHYVTDVVLGALTAALAGLAAKQLLARARPDVWAFEQATA